MHGGIDLREKAFEQNLREFGAREFGADRATDQLGTAARYDERHGIDGRVGEQRFLGRPARVGRRAKLPRIGLRALLGELARDGVGEREVHVVAAEQDMLADRHAMQFQIAFALHDRDQREVGRAAAYVDDQDHVADFHLLAPRAVALLNPAIESATCGSSSSVMRP